MAEFTQQMFSEHLGHIRHHMGMEELPRVAFDLAVGDGL